MPITIYLLTYNEEFMLPFSINFYRARFPDAEIIIYDNFSTDRTVEIAKSLGCRVLRFYTFNQMSDQALINVKNEVWKRAKTNWVIVADCDELVDVWPDDLINNPASILRTRYVQMVGHLGDPHKITLGYIYRGDNKMLCFNKKRIQEINFDFGSHYANPIGDIVFSNKVFFIRHYKFISRDYVIQRHAEIGKRLSPMNRKLKLSYHYLFGARKIAKEHKWFLKNSVKIF